MQIAWLESVNSPEGGMKEGEIFNYAEQEYPECLKMAAKIEFLHKRKTLEIVFIELGFWLEG